MTLSRSEQRNRLRTLPPPPRRVPYAIRARLYLGIVGWAAVIPLLIMVIPVQLFAFGTRSVEALRLGSPDGTANGTVTRVRRTSVSSGKNQNRRYYYENHFVFRTDQGRTVRQHSYSLGGHYRPGNPVQVEYRRASPHLARIRGTEFALAGFLGILLILIPVAAFVAFVVAIFRGRRLVELLAQGRITDGSVISSKPTGTKVNSTPVLRYRFRYQDADGREHTGECKALQDASIGDETAEPVLYLPESPGKGAVLVDALPGQVVLGPDREWRTRSSSGATALIVAIRGLAWAAGLYVIVGALLRWFSP